jgi:hypothetical protein
MRKSLVHVQLWVVGHVEQVAEAVGIDVVAGLDVK